MSIYCRAVSNSGTSKPVISESQYDATLAETSVGTPFFTEPVTTCNTGTPLSISGNSDSLTAPSNESFDVGSVENDSVFMLCCWEVDGGCFGAGVSLATTFFGRVMRLDNTFFFFVLLEDDPPSKPDAHTAKSNVRGPIFYRKRWDNRETEAISLEFRCFHKSNCISKGVPRNKRTLLG